MKGQKNARWMMISAMAIFGTLGPFVRNIAVSSGELALYRAVLAAVLVGAVLLITKQKLPAGSLKRTLPLLFCSGAALGFNWILLFEAYRYTTVSVATLSYYFAPVLVTLLCPVFFREKMTGKKWLCTAMATLGIVLITGLGEFAGEGKHLMGVALGLGAACLYACVVLLNKALGGIDGLHRTFFQFLAAILVLGPYVALSGGVSLGGLDALGWACLLAVGVVHSGLAYCLYFSALKALPGQQTAILSYIDPLVAVVLSAAVLGESMSLTQALGGLLILGFTLWNEMETKKVRSV